MDVISFTQDGLTLSLNWGVLTLLALLLLSLIGLARSTRNRSALSRLADSANAQLAAYGFWRWPSWLLIGTGFLWIGLFLAILGGMVWVPFRLSFQDLTAETQVDLRWFLLSLTALVAALGALVALPFTFLRTAYNARQTKTAEQSHITDQINKAVEALGAEKSVSRIGRSIAYKMPGGITHKAFEWQDERFTRPADATLPEGYEPPDWQNISVTVPNTEVRIGAIYALERIAQDSLRDHVQIMEILTAYIRENAPAESAADHAIDDIPHLPEDASENTRKIVEGDRARRNSEIRKWARNLKPDTIVQAAIRVIGRRTKEQKDIEAADKRYGIDGYRPDLRKTNLQGINMSNLDLSGVYLIRARLEGAWLHNPAFPK